MSVARRLLHRDLSACAPNTDRRQDKFHITTTMKATDPNSDDFSQELWSLHLDYDGIYFDPPSAQGSSQVSSPQAGVCPISQSVRDDLDQLPSSVCPELTSEFGSSLIDHLLLLEQQQPGDNNNSSTHCSKNVPQQQYSSSQQQPMLPYEMPMIMEATHFPMDTGIGEDLSSSQNHHNTSSALSVSSAGSYSHHPTPGSTPPSPFSPYYVTSTPAPTPNETPNSTPARTPSALTPATTPLSTPHSSKPGSPRGSYRRHQLRSRHQRPSSTASNPSPSPSSSQIAATLKNMDPATGDKLPRHKRPSHILAEHKRRYKIQQGFEDIQNLVPAIVDAGTTKPSKSTMLFKTVEYVRQLRNDNKELQRNSDQVRKEIAALTADINQYQLQLPQAGIDINQMETCCSAMDEATKAALTAGVKDEAAGGDGARSGSGRSMQEMFQDYVQAKSLSNWKFAIFGILLRPLFASYRRVVSGCNSMDSLCRTTMSWLEEHLSLIALRPAWFDALRQLSSETSVVTTPERLPEEIINNVLRESFPQQTSAS